MKIEENGPARCVVLVKGSHRDKGGVRMFGYFARLYFHRGRREVRVDHTLTHDSKEQQTAAPYPPFRSMGLITRIAANGGVTVRVVKDNGEVKAAPKEGSPVTFGQFWPKGGFIKTGTTQWYLGLSPKASKDPKLSGCVVTRGGKELWRGGADKSPDLAWLDCGDADGAGVTVGVRFAAGNFPKTLSADCDGNVTVGLYPSTGTRWGIGRGSHNTQQVLYVFHAKAAKAPSAAMFRFQYPLVGRATVPWYNRNVRHGEIYPLYHFVSRKEEARLAEKHKWPSKHQGRNVRFAVWRGWYWGQGGFSNQHDFARIAFVNFLRDERLDRAGQYYLWAEDRFGYNADWSVHHGDIRGGFGGKITFEFEHRHWYGMPLFYYATGDQRIGDAAVEYAYKMLDELKGSKAFFGWPRVFGWAMYSLGAGYDLTGDEKFRQVIRDRVGQVVAGKTRYKADPLRGAFRGGTPWQDTKKNVKIKPPLMFGYIEHDGMWNARWQFGWDDAVAERLDGWIEGKQWLMARECYFTSKGRWGNMKTWTPYTYSLNRFAGPPKPGFFMVGEAFYSVLLPTLVNGEEYSPGLLRKLVRSSYQQIVVEMGFTFLDRPGTQAALYYTIHPPADVKPPQAITDLTAEALGGGKVRLTWTTPAGVTRLRARHADRLVAPNLNYDRDKKTFERSPEKFANWWAAADLRGEPHGQPGTKQSFVASGIEPGRRVFAMRGWNAQHRRSSISNQATVDVK